MRRIILFKIILALPLISFSQAQILEIYSSGGGYFGGQTIQQSWTMGEPIIETSINQTMTFTQGFQQSDLLRGLRGQVTYDNSSHSVLNNTNIFIKKGGTTYYQEITNSGGYYKIQTLQNGNYHIDANCTKPWGGGNAIDALLIMKHFSGQDPLSGIKLKAADVNSSGNVNSVDALLVMKRFVGLNSSFDAGDWVFENHNVTVNGFSNLVDNFKGVCAGDVDGSFIPSNLRTETTVKLEDNEVIKVSNGEKIVVPVFIKDDISISALSLVLKYPEKQFQIKSVFMNTDKQNLVFNVINGELRIAWYTLSPLSLKPGEILLNIEVLANWGNNDFEGYLDFNLGDETQLGNFSGDVILDKTIEIPSFIKEENGFYLWQNKPNPALNNTAIDFSLPEPGNVQLWFNNSLGQKSIKVMQSDYGEGTHSYIIDCKNLPAGVYYYSMIYLNKVRQYSATRRMVVIH